MFKLQTGRHKLHISSPLVLGSCVSLLNTISSTVQSNTKAQCFIVLKLYLQSGLQSGHQDTDISFMIVY